MDQLYLIYLFMIIIWLSNFLTKQLLYPNKDELMKLDIFRCDLYGSILHSITITMACLMNFIITPNDFYYLVLSMWSLSYFSFDLINVIYQLDYMFIFHHIISISGIIQHSKNNVSKPIRKHTTDQYLISMVCIVGLISLYLGYTDEMAWTTTIVYLSSYLLYSNKRISKNSYLAWSIIGFFYSIPHLLNHFNYAVLVEAIVIDTISLIGLIKYYFFKNKNNSPKKPKGSPSL